MRFQSLERKSRASAKVLLNGYLNMGIDLVYIQLDINARLALEVLSKF